MQATVLELAGISASFLELPNLEIAAAWGMPAQDVHNAYKTARKDFYRCLREVVAFHRPGVTDLNGECRALLGMLG